MQLSPVERAPVARVWGLKGSILFLEIVYFFLLGGAATLQWVGGAQRPVGRGNEPKKTGGRSARARTRGQNPLVLNYNLFMLYYLSSF